MNNLVQSLCFGSEHQNSSVWFKVKICMDTIISPYFIKCHIHHSFVCLPTLRLWKDSEKYPRRSACSFKINSCSYLINTNPFWGKKYQYIAYTLLWIEIEIKKQQQNSITLEPNCHLWYIHIIHQDLHMQLQVGTGTGTDTDTIT